MKILQKLYITTTNFCYPPNMLHFIQVLRIYTFNKVGLSRKQLNKHGYNGSLQKVLHWWEALKEEGQNIPLWSRKETHLTPTYNFNQLIFVSANKAIKT